MADSPRAHCTSTPLQNTTAGLKFTFISTRRKAASSYGYSIDHDFFGHAVTATPEIDDDYDIEINPADLKVVIKRSFNILIQFI